MSDFETSFHRHLGQTKNVEYVCDGRVEGVYDPAGNLVTNAANAGTLNLADPRTDKVGHIIKDIVPYIAWGNTPSDPVRWKRRAVGTLLDRK